MSRAIAPDKDADFRDQRCTRITTPTRAGKISVEVNQVDARSAIWPSPIPPVSLKLVRHIAR